ncbi:uncharacterized protein LOC117318016 [Pecten maximus]|uniref:uncharacterized protein LOC117318016 n=1 Tax=Pecten maximus TaxID=6579 RepID=UPI001458E011|nr:uncharacterized protein LOC117318016 [Pecten maximus]
MSAILGSYRLSQKRKAEKLKIKKKQQEIKKELKASQQIDPPNYQYQHPNDFEGAQPCAPIWEDGVYDDSPFSPDVVFDPEYSEWKFMYGPSEDQEKLYVVRIYRSDRILYVNGEKLKPNDYNLEEQKGGSVIKIHFRVGKFKCEIKSSLTETPNDQNQTLIFNGNRIQFEEDAFDAE